jgi:amino acid permease
MSLPFAFAQSGWLVGTLCMLAVGAFSLSTMRAIIDAVHLTRKRLRRRRKAKIAHSHSRRSMAGGSADYGSMEAAASPPPPAGSPGPDSEFALDPLDLSIIKADPDADIINFQQIAYCCYGEKGRIFTDSVLIFTQMGSCSAFLLLVLGNLQAVLAACGWSVPMEPIALFLLPVIALLAIPRSTTFLAGAAHFGNFTMLVALGTIVFFGLTSQSSHVGAAVADHGVEGLMSVMAALPAWSGSLNGIAVFFGISAFR